MKIGILSLPVNHNYGCVLQIWALYTFLKNEGHEVFILNRRWNNVNKNSLLKKIIRKVYQDVFCYPFTSFIKNNTLLTNEVRSSKDLRLLVEKLSLDAIVVGSDQIWRIENTRGVDLNYFLDFTAGMNLKRLSYAASFGIDKWNGTKEETEKVSMLLKRFNKISVREYSGINLCKKHFNIEACQVLDPTLLIEASKYKTLFGNKVLKENILATYILDKNKLISDSINNISKKEKLKVRNLYGGEGYFSYYISIKKWLLSIHSAKYVIVDSFHGMIFSIIFRKQFLVICNKNRGETRFTSLLTLLNLNNRIITDISELNINRLKEKIDYELVEYKINELRNKSIIFLKELNT